MGHRLRLFLAYTEAEFANAYPPETFARLERSVEVVRHRGAEPLRGAALASAAQGCELVIGYRSTPCDAEALQGMPQLLAFLRAAVDLSTVDVAEASRQGILVTRVSPGFHGAVAELGIGLMIDLARGITYHRLQPEGGRGLAPRQGMELAGARLGFIGYGGIARQMNRLARALGMHTSAFDPLLHEADVPLLPMNAVLQDADFVVCLAAAKPETRHLFDANTFARMKRGAFFVNLSRGELVDEDALERALDNGLLGGAALDVGSAPDQKPAARFIARPDVVVTQHIGATTTQARARQTRDTLAQVEEIVAGHLPAGAVNADAAHRLARRFPLPLNALPT
jgi:D-3-phosphoglycerate dehydrogenase